MQKLQSDRRILRKKIKQNLSHINKKSPPLTVYYETVIEGLKDYSICLLDVKGIVLHCNQATEVLFGYKKEEFIGQKISIVYTEEDKKAKKPEREIRTVLRNGASEHESWAVRRDGSLLWASGVLRAIYDENGKVQFIAKILRDLTDAKQIEIEKDEFVSIVSHELKNPLTSMMGFTQLLKKRLKILNDKESLQYVDRLNAQLNRQTRLITNLLDKSKIRAQGFDFHDRLFDFDRLISSVIHDLQRANTTHKITLKGKSGQKIRADKERIGQVIQNIISNAIKYSPEEKEVIVKVKKAKDNLVISVQDFGMGISQQNLKKIFTPFFRATVAQRESFPSIGLGLYISAEIARHYNGKIWVESTEGKGSTFYFSLPINQ